MTMARKIRASTFVIRHRQHPTRQRERPLHHGVDPVGEEDE
jgi:hypothetical protein